MSPVDVAIVGAGPGGLSAAEFLAHSSLSVVVIDEQSRPGGQITRQPPRQFDASDWLEGKIYANQKALLQRVSNLEQIQWRPDTCVAGIEESASGNQDTGSYQLLLDSPDGASLLSAKAVIVTAGCYDMPICFPGWTLPGCMATGGIQAMIKGQQVVPGDQIVFVGTHPLQLIVADQIIQAGGKVSEIVFVQNRRAIFGSVTKLGMLLTHWTKALHLAGVLRRLAKAGVPITYGHTIVRAIGDQKLEKVELSKVSNSGTVNFDSTRTIDCDCLGICFGFLASSELLRQVGAECKWSPHGGGWVTVVDEWMRTNKPRIYAAGEVTGVAGAESAILGGAIAAHALCEDLGEVSNGRNSKAIHALSKRYSNEQRFALFLRQTSAVPDSLVRQLISKDSIVCKCQDITFGQLHDLLSELPYRIDSNSLKLLSRVGMGLCQGRYCSYYVNKLVCWTNNASEQSNCPFTAQIPIKPILIGSITQTKGTKF